MEAAGSIQDNVAPAGLLCRLLLSCPLWPRVFPVAPKGSVCCCVGVTEGESCGATFRVTS